MKIFQKKKQTQGEVPLPVFLLLRFAASSLALSCTVATKLASAGLFQCIPTKTVKVKAKLPGMHV